jgi:hypothetical protein
MAVNVTVNTMLKFSFLRSLASPVLLPEDHDRKLRLAFGRCAEERYRAEGARIVSQYYGQNGCFQCDCRPDAERAPLLFLVTGNHIRREEKVGGKGTPHDDNCDFAYEPDEQKHLVRTWQPLKKNERLLNLVKDFTDGDQQPSSTPSYISTRSRAPRLARILFNLLHEAKIDRLYSTEDLYGCAGLQNENLLRAAVKFFVTPERSLLDWIATSLPEFYELTRRLEVARSPEWNRPCGLFIETFGKIENKTLYPYRSDRKPIKVVGDLAIYGEKDHLRRPPYLVIGSMTFPTKESKTVELYNAYAHPCYRWDNFMLTDSKLERRTLELLVDCRDALVEKHGISVTIEKPVFDLGSTETDNPREVCKPDFVLHCRRGNSPYILVIIETMGYDDPIYRERKRRMRPLFETIKGGSPPHAVIEYDIFKREMKPTVIDDQFRKKVYTTILEKCAHTE